ncbi:hypothetical protein Tco_1139322, partial [Tanacetum coccineum]
KRETRYSVSRFQVAFSPTISAGGGGARGENTTHGVVFTPWTGVFADGSSHQPPYLVALGLHSLSMEKGFLTAKERGNGKSVKEKHDFVVGVHGIVNDGMNSSSGITNVTSALESLGNTFGKESERLSFSSNGIALSLSISYAKLITGEPSRKTVNFRTLLSPARNGADVAISLESVRAISERFANTFYGFFLGKRVVYPVVANYAKNAWSKYGLVKSILNSSNGLFFLKFGSKDGMDVMLENGTLLMLDSYTIVVAISKLVGEGFYMCTILKNLKNPRQAVRGVQVGPKVGFKPTKQVYKPVSNKNSVSTSGKKKQAKELDERIVIPTHLMDLIQLKMMMTWVRMGRIQSRLGRGQNSDSEVEEVVNEHALFVASTDLKSVNDNGHGNDSLLKQWREVKRDDDYDCYDDDMYESHDTYQNLQGICDDFDITVRGWKKKYIYFDVC